MKVPEEGKPSCVRLINSRRQQKRKAYSKCAALLFVGLLTVPKGSGGCHDRTLRTRRMAWHRDVAGGG